MFTRLVNNASSFGSMAQEQTLLPPSRENQPDVSVDTLLTQTAPCELEATARPTPSAPAAPPPRAEACAAVRLTKFPGFWACVPKLELQEAVFDLLDPSLGDRCVDIAQFCAFTRQPGPPRKSYPLVQALLAALVFEDGGYAPGEGLFRERNVYRVTSLEQIEAGLGSYAQRGAEVAHDLQERVHAYLWTARAQTYRWQILNDEVSALQRVVEAAKKSLPPGVAKKPAEYQERWLGSSHIVQDARARMASLNAQIKARPSQQSSFGVALPEIPRARSFYPGG